MTQASYPNWRVLDVARYAVGQIKHWFPVAYMHVNFDPIARLGECYNVINETINLCYNNKAIILDIINKALPNINTIDSLVKHTFGNLLWHTPCGHLLRSGFEYDFYKALESENLLDYMLIEHNYPNSTMRSDFYFPAIDVHIEICGMMNVAEYAEKMRFKEETYSEHKYNQLLTILRNNYNATTRSNIRYKYDPISTNHIS